MLPKSFRTAAAGLLIGAFALAGAHAQAPAAWEAGKHYFLIDPPVATSTPGKIEVTEVFSYGCPACNFSLPSVDKLAKSLPPNAVMNYVPASFNPAEDWPLFQRTFFTAQALGLDLEKTHHAMFDAVWKTHELATMNADGRTLKNPQPPLEEVARFFVGMGVKAEDFTATATSFSINTKMKQADAYIKATGVDVTPTIIVNGKYRLTTTSAGGDWDKASQLVLFLVNKESGAK
jgi:protein dithiol oxidoreductase (disulfide-forming)